jgi:hypothetical protein
METGRVSNYHGGKQSFNSQRHRVLMAKKKRTTDPKYPDIESWISEQPKVQQTKLRAALTSICKLHRESRSTDLTWWHDIGVQVDKFFS